MTRALAMAVLALCACHKSPRQKPAGSPAPAPPALEMGEVPLVRVAPGGATVELRVAGKTTSMDTDALVQALSQLARGQPEPELEVVAAHGVPFQAVLRVLDAARQAGYQRWRLSDGVVIDAPRAATGGVVEVTLVISVTRDGQVFVGGRQAVGVLAAYLRDLPGPRDRPVLLQADGAVMHARVVEVLDAAKDAGYRRFGLQVEVAPPQPLGSIRIEISPAGQLTMDGLPVPPDGLRALLDGKPHDAEVLIKAAKDVPYRLVVDVIDITKASGFTRFSLSMAP